MFIHFLLAPINLLFLANAFIFIYVAPFFWRSFISPQGIADLLSKATISKDSASVILLVLPVLLIPLLLYCYFILSLKHGYNFYPMSTKLNLIFIVFATICLLLAKKINYNNISSKQNLLISTFLYLIISYFMFLIILGSTAIFCINALPNNLAASNYQIDIISYIAHLVTLSILIFLSAKQRIPLFLLYFLAQSYLNYSWYGHIYYAF